MARRRARARPHLGGHVHRGVARLRGRGRGDRLARRDRPRRVPRPLPDPRDLHVPHQPLARGDAGGGRGQPARVRAHVARARHPGVGRGLVGDAGHGRRPARPDPRRAARLDRHAPERDGRRGDRPLLLHAGRRAEPDRLRGGELPVGALPVPGAAAASRSSRSRTTPRSSTRSTSGRCSSRSATSCSRTARSRTSSRSSGARGRPAPTWCSTATSRRASCRST